MLEQAHRSRRPQRPRRRNWPRVLALVAAVLLAFALGLSLGKALDDGPEPGATVTSVRTLEPLPQQPATTP
jgi:ferric-dicitrate binding protein FerR (iron transport regulator)